MPTCCHRPSLFSSPTPGSGSEKVKEPINMTALEFVLWLANEGMKRTKNIPLKCSCKQQIKLSKCSIFYPSLKTVKIQKEEGRYQQRSNWEVLKDTSSLQRPIQCLHGNMEFQGQDTKEA